jgi:hypothetical protein
MNKVVAGIVMLAFALGASAGAAMLFAAKRVPNATSALSPRWTETRWPFPMDQWGLGQAFRCSAVDCGSDVQLYLRSKTGFCNCNAGITDDDELNRVSDAELFGPALVPQTAGRVIATGGLTGRSQSFAGAQTSRPGQGIWVAALHLRCDAVVVTALAAEDELARIEPAVIAFLDRRLPLQTTVAAAGR